MSLFAGIFSLNGLKPIAPATSALIEKAIARDEGRRETFTHPYFFLVKYDFGAFGEPGYVADAQQGVAAIAGEPILTLGGQESFSRLADLNRLAAELSHDNLAALTSCQGTYALCYYNAANHTLLLATDKLGVRPVYYYADADFLYFASCLRILEALAAIPRRLDLRAFIEHAVFLGVPLGNRTLYRDIKVLRDGQYLRGNTSGMDCAYYFRWDQLPIRPKNLDSILEDCYTAFQAAVFSRSKRAAQAFSFLTGGLDSRCIVAMLHLLHKDVIALNSSRPAVQDQIFAEQYAKRLGIRYIAAPRPPEVIANTTTRLYEEAITRTRTKMDAPYPTLIFSGDGGSVGVGFVYMDSTLFDLLRRGNLPQAIQYYLKKHRLPHKIIRSDRKELLHIPFTSLQEELEDLRGVERQRAFYLFLLRNDQRRHLHEYYEDIDQYQVELLSPFYDMRFLEIIASAAIPFETFLAHNFYYQWLERFPEDTRSVPWQAYPGHLPCPLPETREIRPQWYMTRQDEFLTSQPVLQACLQILRKSDFPNDLIRKPIVFLAILLHRLKIHNYAYVFEFCVNLYKQHVKCTATPAE